MFVHVCALIDEYENTGKPNSESLKRARELRRALLRPATSDYAVDDWIVMSAHIEVIVENYMALASLVEVTHHVGNAHSDPRRLKLLALLCGERAQRYVILKTFGLYTQRIFEQIERAHAALGNPPGAHALSKIRSHESLVYAEEIQRIVARGEQVLMPLLRFQTDLRDHTAAESESRKSDRELLLQDLKEQAPEARAAAFLSALELCDLVTQSPIAKEKPSLGYDIVKPAKILISLPADLRGVAYALAAKKLVFSKDAALGLLRVCAGQKLDLGQGYKAIPPQLWKSLGECLPKNSPNVRQILGAATALSEKQKQSLSMMTGLTSEDDLRDDVVEKYENVFREAQESLSYALDDIRPRTYPSNVRPNLLARLFSLAKTNRGDVVRSSFLEGTRAFENLAAALLPAFYMDVDTSFVEGLMTEAKELSIACIGHDGNGAIPKSSEEAFKLSSSLSYQDPAHLAAWRLGVVLLLDEVAERFRRFSPEERELIRGFATSLHLLPTSGKPSAKWLDAVTDMRCDEILEKLLQEIGPISRPEDDIIVAAVLATVRMPGVATQTLVDLIPFGLRRRTARQAPRTPGERSHVGPVAATGRSPDRGHATRCRDVPIRHRSGSRGRVSTDDDQRRREQSGLDRRTAATRAQDLAGPLSRGPIRRNCRVRLHCTGRRLALLGDDRRQDLGQPIAADEGGRPGQREEAEKSGAATRAYVARPHPLDRTALSVGDVLSVRRMA